MKIAKSILFPVFLSCFMFSCQTESHYITPEMTDLTIAVYASATVQPEGHYQLFPEVNGIISKIHLEEGDTLNQGDPLAIIKPFKENYDVQSAGLQKNLAETRLSSDNNQLDLLENDIQKWKQQCQTDSIQKQRLENLWKQNIGSKSELDNIRLKYTLCIESLELAKIRYQKEKRELQNLLEQAKINLEKSKSILNDYIVKSQSSGRIFKLYKEAGEMISRQEPLAEIGSVNDFIIEMQVDEVDISNIKLGQTILLALDAYPEEVFEAELVKINPRKNPKNLSFEVEAKFITKPKVLYAGLSGEANIIIQKKKNVLTVPLEYLSENNTLVGLDETEYKVESGLRNIDRIEIISGVDTTTQLIKPQR